MYADTYSHAHKFFLIHIKNTPHLILRNNYLNDKCEITNALSIQEAKIKKIPRRHNSGDS